LINKVANLREGSFFGEYETLRDLNREYTAISKSSSTLVYKISKDVNKFHVKRANFIRDMKILLKNSLAALIHFYKRKQTSMTSYEKRG